MDIFYLVIGVGGKHSHRTSPGWCFPPTKLYPINLMNSLRKIVHATKPGGIVICPEMQNMRHSEFWLGLEFGMPHVYRLSAVPNGSKRGISSPIP